MVAMKIKHSCICSDCHKQFFLEDAIWCKHYKNLKIGSKECPNCSSCICHANTIGGIKRRFNRNIRKGKFVKIPKEKQIFGWEWMCKTVKEVEV